MKEIRNKFQHEPHNIWWYNHSPGEHLKLLRKVDFVYEVNDRETGLDLKKELMTFDIAQLLLLLIKLNETYIRIQEKFKEIYSEDKNRHAAMTNHAINEMKLKKYKKKIEKKLKARRNE